MLRVMCMVLLMAFLSGCSSEDSDINRTMEFRSDLLKAEQCSCDMQITADYGDKQHTFQLGCVFDSMGDMSFTVLQPQSIAGISGEISQSGGNIRFDDVALGFEPLTDQQISPISAPWILMRCLRSGYLHACGQEAEYLRITIDDEYGENDLRADVWLNAENIPERADIMYDGRRIAAIRVLNYQIQ